MKRIAVLIAVLLFVNAFAAAQVGKFRWETEMCRFEGTFDTKRYTKKQLENTYKMWFAREYDMDTFYATVFKLEDFAKLRTAASIDEEYARKSAALKKLVIVNTPFWKEFRAKKLIELERDYRLARASAQAFQKPAALREVTFADACVQKYAPPLTAGGDSLLGIWREVNMDLRAKNSDPERLRREFEAQMASADRFKYAQIEVITFGWWNCVNERIERREDWDAIYKNYEKLFKKVSKTCEEP
jgi:hypothetical protein